MRIENPCTVGVFGGRSKPKGDIVTSTEHAILVEISLTGQAIILLHKPREFKAASQLAALRIIHIDAGNDRMWVVKFGRAPFGHQPREIEI